MAFENPHLINMLVSREVLKKDESIDEFLQANSIDHINKELNRYFEEKREKIIEFAIAMEAFTLSLWLHEIFIDENSTIEVKYKAKVVRSQLDDTIIDFLHPQILKFFKWDLERRNWSSNTHDEQLDFISNLEKDISLELKGANNQTVDKYLMLLMEFISDYVHKVLKNPEVFNEFASSDQLVNRNPYQVFEIVDNLKKAAELGVGNDIREKIWPPIQAQIKSYSNGLLAKDGKFSNLTISFVKAQFQYRTILRDIIRQLKGDNEKEYIRLAAYLRNRKYDLFEKGLKALFASIPSVLIKNTTEAYYHIFIHLVLRLIGCDIESEVNTNLGRIDAVLRFPNQINIFEFKMIDNNDAIYQIIDRKYFHRYLDDQVAINLIGVTFSYKKRNIDQFEVIENYKE